MVDKGFYHECGNVKTHDIRILYDMSKWCNLVVDIKFIAAAQPVYTFCYLLFKYIFIRGLNKIILDKLHGNGIRKGFDTISCIFYCFSTGIFF